jgi:predicted dehydrogenase
MAQDLTRRRFLIRTGGAAAALTLPSIWPGRVLGANERLGIAAIGVGGKGDSDLAFCEGETVVALCDVDETNAAGAFQRHRTVPRYRDYRAMLEKESPRIDAVTVSAPDHIHAPASALALRLGKHVYCQKPLTHSIQEARVLTELAREKKVATQMGNQGYSHPGTRRLAELVRGGALGTVREAHVWTDRPIWPQGVGRPKETPPVPPTLDWDLWLGPASERPYHPDYVPFKWRGWWDFGTGALGDMGCHNMGLFFLALDPKAPISVEAESSGSNGETFPSWSVITYVFPGEEGKPGPKLVWYDGGKKPPASLAKGKTLPANGVILVGEKDSLFVPSYWGEGEFLSGAKVEDMKAIPELWPKREGAARENDQPHHLEWIEAAKGGPRPLSSFEHSGPMTESVLLGNVALAVGKKIEWDSKSLTARGVPEAARYIRREYRKGWGL